MRVVNGQYRNLMRIGVFQGKFPQQGRCGDVDHVGVKILQFLPHPSLGKPGNGHLIRFINRNGGRRDNHAFEAFNGIGANATNEQKFKLIRRYPMDQLEHSTGSPIKIFDKDFCKKGNFDFFQQREFDVFLNAHQYRKPSAIWELTMAASGDRTKERRKS